MSDNDNRVVHVDTAAFYKMAQQARDLMAKDKASGNAGKIPANIGQPNTPPNTDVSLEYPLQKGGKNAPKVYINMAAWNAWQANLKNIAGQTQDTVKIAGTTPEEKPKETLIQKISKYILSIFT